MTYAAAQDEDRVSSIKTAAVVDCPEIPRAEAKMHRGLRERIEGMSGGTLHIIGHSINSFAMSPKPLLPAPNLRKPLTGLVTQQDMSPERDTFMTSRGIKSRLILGKEPPSTGSTMTAHAGCPLCRILACGCTNPVIVVGRLGA